MPPAELDLARLARMPHLAAGVVRAAQRPYGTHLFRVWDRGAPADVPSHGGEPVEKVVLTRGSQALMDPSQGLSNDVLHTSLRGITVPH